MEGCSNNNTENCPNLLDLISKESKWLVNVEPEQRKSHGYSSSVAVKNKLELKLGLPGDDEDWSQSQNKNHPWTSSSSQINYNNHQQTNFAAFLHNLSPSQSSPAMGNESSQLCCNEVLDLEQPAENKPFSKLPVPNSSQKRTAPAPVVGWPPIRSFRKNLASTSTSKLPHTDSQNENNIPNDKPGETITKKSTFVKINMDGVPIGRKIDLSSHDSYKKLSTAVDELFRGLLAAQRDSSAGINTLEDEKPITGVLGGSGEYTLVYEDNEGDRMLVGDVPWHMFVSTVKRLRVLKSSEVSALNLGNGKREKITNV